MDIREVIRQFRNGVSDRAIQRMSGMHRKTVKRYRNWAEEQGLLEGRLPPLDELERLLQASMPEPLPPQNQSSLEAFRPLVVQLRKEGVEMTAILQRLRERGFTGSYSAVRRFVKHLEERQPDVMVRMECQPGEEAQVDFGFAGLMYDPETQQMRRTWAFVMTLSWSRHVYVEFVFDQKLPTWLLLHRHAFEWFGGVPERLVIDNLKSAIVEACFHEPVVQQSYRECAEHYGFQLAPCRIATPRHKGKVESGVHYVKRNFLAGRTPTSLTQANTDVCTWCMTTAGLRIHGTTREQPLVRFQETEAMRLKSLPEVPYDLAVWKEATVGRDGHITFDNAYYSIPFRIPKGTKVRVRGGAQFVTIFGPGYEALATHDRAQHPGQRLTHPDHLPPEKAAGVALNRDACRDSAVAIGPATDQIVSTLLADPVIDRLRTAGRLLRLGERYGNERLEAACQRALHFGEPSYLTVKRILMGELDAQPAVAPSSSLSSPSSPYLFARRAYELLGHLFGGATWN